MNIPNQDLIGYYGNFALLICRNVSENKFAYILQKLLDPTSVATRLNYSLSESIFFPQVHKKAVCPSDQEVYHQSLPFFLSLLLLDDRLRDCLRTSILNVKDFILIFSQHCFLLRSPPLQNKLYCPSNDK